MHRIQFLLADPLSYNQGVSLSSPWRPLDDRFSCCLQIYPRGCKSTTSAPELAAFLTVHGPGRTWLLEGLRFMVQVVNTVGDVRKQAGEKDFGNIRDTLGFKAGLLKCEEMTKESGWLNTVGELCVEAVLDLTTSSS